MTLQSINVPTLPSAMLRPRIVVLGLLFFRRPVTDLVTVLGKRAHKSFFGRASLELAELKETLGPILDTEIRPLDVGLAPRSGYFDSKRRTPLNNPAIEHAKGLSADRIERLLGGDLRNSKLGAHAEPERE